VAQSVRWDGDALSLTCSRAAAASAELESLPDIVADRARALSPMIARGTCAAMAIGLASVRGDD
jgi:hypothetical protein